MGAGASADTTDLEAIKATILEKLAAVKQSNPENLCAKHLTAEYIDSLAPEEQKVLYRCTLTGLENADSQLGCYAMTPKDYETFKTFFDKVIRDYHGDETGEKKHVTNWDIKLDASSPPAEGEEKHAEAAPQIDLAQFGLSDVSMRVRVGRNLADFNLPGMMTKEERIKFEQKMTVAFQVFINDPEFGGKIHSLTPDFKVAEDQPEEETTNSNLISSEEYDDLVAKHLMFKNMDNDPYLLQAGISSDWPYGRGCYVSEKQDFIVWFGEEDQLRIMCMETGSNLACVFNKLKTFLEKIESQEGIEFAKSEEYGYLTSCPSNLGTGMRASVHIKVPNLIKQGGEDNQLMKVKEICDALGLSVRGVGGEHTPVGDDGTVDISPKARLFIEEGEIVVKLFEGIKQLTTAETAAAAESPPAAEESPEAPKEEAPAE